MYLNYKLTWESGGIILFSFIVGIIGCLWEGRLAFKYKKIKRHLTKRINAVIIGSAKWGRYYIYCYSGLDEYDGIIFYDRCLEVRTEYEEGTIVSLLINEYNLEEFWFEEARQSHSKYAVALGGNDIVCFLFYVALFSL